MENGLQQRRVLGPFRKSQEFIQEASRVEKPTYLWPIFEEEIIGENDQGPRLQLPRLPQTTSRGKYFSLSITNPFFLIQMKSRIMLGSAAFSMFCMWQVNNTFYGIVLGKLPFQPWSMVSGMSHRGLEGEDMNEFSMIFIYVLSQMAFRGMIGKIMGSEGPRMSVEHQTPKWLQEYANKQD